MELTNDSRVGVDAAPAEPEIVEESGEVASQTDIGPPVAIQVSTEAVLYAALILLALTLRLVGLGSASLGDAEAHEALTAMRATSPESTQADSTRLAVQNPLMFTANTLIMTLAGIDNAAPRLPTALMGVLLVLTPLLFRRWLGPVQAASIAVLLAISPVLLLASRTMGAPIWSMACALIGAYFVGRFLETRGAGYAIAATVAFAFLILMAEPAGFVTALGLLAGIIFAASARDVPEDRYRRAIGETLQSWPWLRALLIAGAVIGLVATVFLLYPRGLSTIGEVLNQAVGGIVMRPAGNPFAFPLLTSLLYEPVLWIFGLIGAYWVLTHDHSGEEPFESNRAFIHRVLVGWLGVSFIASILYQGAQAAHALWFTIPLAGLSALVIEKILSPVRDRFWEVPRWGPYLHGAGVVAMLAITGINLLILGHMIVGTSPAELPKIDQPVRLVFIVPAIMLIVITFFLVGSMWGARAAWYGLGIGTLIFFALYGLGAGWHAAAINADDPREFWNVHPAASNLALLEDTLAIASRRSTGMPYDMDLLIVTNPDGPSDDGALAWALRRFHHAQYVKELAPTTSAPVIIQSSKATAPKLGMAYVGQDFPVYYTWDRGSLSWDILTWIYDRETRVPPQSDERVIAWVRGDVYGLPPESQDTTNPNTGSLTNPGSAEQDNGGNNPGGDNPGGNNSGNSGANDSNNNNAP